MAKRPLQKPTGGLNTAINRWWEVQSQWIHLQRKSCTQGSENSVEECVKRLWETEDQKVRYWICLLQRTGKLLIPQPYACLNKFWTMMIATERLTRKREHNGALLLDMELQAPSDCCEQGKWSSPGLSTLTDCSIPTGQTWNHMCT